MMSDQQFDQKLRHIEDQYAARRDGADAYRDQELARLFEECGWPQEKIARHMGKKQRWVSYRLCFGRFLSFSTSGANAPVANLTERRFREYWSRTKGKESERFEQVAEVLKNGIPQGIVAIQTKPGIQKAVIETFSNGKWHLVSQIAEQIQDHCPGATSEQVRNCINKLRDKPPAGYHLEAKQIGKQAQYRLAKHKSEPGSHQTSTAPVLALYEKAAPLIAELDELGHMHEACMSPVAVRMIAAKLRRLFDSVPETATA